MQVLLIGGSTGTMLESLQVVGEGHDGSPGEGHDGLLDDVRSLFDYLDIAFVSFCSLMQVTLAL